MHSVGPQLPAHLSTKRKRDDSDDDPIPIPPKGSRSSSSPTSSDKHNCRIIGPAAPPASLAKLPPADPDKTPTGEKKQDNDDSSSDDDDFGPSLPPAPGSRKAAEEHQRQQKLEDRLAAKEAAKRPQREEWMLVPPSSSDWGSRVDPTKLKNRKFNTGKGSKGPSTQSSQGGGVDSTWLETPEQKRQRLEDEVLGRKKPAQLGPSEDDEKDRLRAKEARATEARIREFNERSNRGGSLMEEHMKGAKTEGREKEDDPSKRAFDREKDVGLAVKIGSKGRRELLGKAKDFGGRFAGGRYL
ncbi:MAG: hypothetical protein Q9217_006414 [Psora testacea]